MSELGTANSPKFDSPAAFTSASVTDPAKSAPAAESAPVHQQPQLTGDTVAHDSPAFSSALARFAAALRDSQGQVASVSPTTVQEELTERYGPRLVQLVSALPTAMRAEFLSQLAVAQPSASVATPKPEAAATSATGADIGSIIQSGIAGPADVGASLAAARLANYVARYGVDAGMQLASPTPALQSEGPLPVAVAGFAPQYPSVDPREKRRHEEHRRRREPERQADVEPRDEQPIYTIDDIVQFAGATVGERHTSPSESRPL